MTTVSRQLNEVVNFTRGTGATRINAAGLIVGVDFSSSSVVFGTGNKTFTLTAEANVNRDWPVGSSVHAASQAAPLGEMVGTVVSYDPVTQVLVINVATSTGTGTGTNWRIGSLEARRDSKGIFQEPQASTVTIQSENLADAYWSVQNGTITPNAAIGTDGNNSAVLFTDNAIVDTHGIGRAVTVTVGLLHYVVADFKKGTSKFAGFTTALAGNQSAIFNFDTLAISNTTGIIETRLEQRPNGIYRFYAAFITTTATSRVVAGPSRGVTGQNYLAYAGLGETVIIDHFQLVQGQISSYIPTTTIAVTRAADSLTLNSTALASLRAQQGTLYVDALYTPSLTRQAAVRLVGTNSEVSVARQGVGTVQGFTKMVEQGDIQLFGSSTGGNLFKSLGKQYEAALGTRNDTGATNVNLDANRGSNAVASSGNGFGIVAQASEMTIDATLSSVSVRGVGNQVLNRGVWTGSRFIFAQLGAAAGQFQPLISIDGQSYRLIQSPTVDTGANDVAVGVVGGINRVVMVGNTQGANSRIWTSDDQGETWTSRIPGANGTFCGVAFGNGVYVAIANNNAANSRYSPDGITWSAVTGLTGTPSDITHTGTQFVVINTVGGVFTSADGVTFTEATVTGISPAFTSAQGIAYDNGFYTIVGNTGQIVIAQAAANATSFTFTTFASAATGTTQPLNQVLSFGGQFYAVGNTAQITQFNQSLTPTFTSRTPGGFNATLGGIAASATTLLIVGTGGAIISSTDGVSYVSRSNNNANLNGIAFGNNTFVSVGNSANGSGYIATIAPDGTVTRRVSGLTQSLTSSRFFNGIFFATSNSASTGRYSTDNGVTWSALSLPNISSYDIAFGNSFYVIVGQGNGGVNFAFSTDSVNYTGVILPGSPNFGTNNPSISFGNGLFVAVGRAGIMYTATNPTLAANWTRVSSGTVQDLTSVMYSIRDAAWYAAGANGTLLRSDDNAVTWYSVQGSAQAYVSNNNVLQANVGQPATDNSRVALSFIDNTIKLSVDGRAVSTDSVADVANVNAVELGKDFNGFIRQVKYFPESYGGSELIQISLGSNTPTTNDSLAVNANGDTLQINASGDTLRIN